MIFMHTELFRSTVYWFSGLQKSMWIVSWTRWDRAWLRLAGREAWPDLRMHPEPALWAPLLSSPGFLPHVEWIKEHECQAELSIMSLHGSLLPRWRVYFYFILYIYFLLSPNLLFRTSFSLIPLLIFPTQINVKLCCHFLLVSFIYLFFETERTWKPT